MFGTTDEMRNSANGATGLKKNTIHNVKLNKVAKGEVSGGLYKVIEFEFGNDEGNYTHKMFEPTGERLQREIKTNADGSSWTSASNLDHINLLMSQLTKALDTPNIPQSQDWESFRNNVVSLFTPAVGKELQIKLISDKDNNFPALAQYVARIDKDGNLKTKTTAFAKVGEPLGFTPNETKEKNRKEAAAPSDMPDTPNQEPDLGDL